MYPFNDMLNPLTHTDNMQHTVAPIDLGFARFLYLSALYLGLSVNPFPQTGQTSPHCQNNLRSNHD